MTDTPYFAKSPLYAQVMSAVNQFEFRHREETGAYFPSASVVAIITAFIFIDLIITIISGLSIENFWKSATILASLASLILWAKLRRINGLIISISSVIFFVTLIPVLGVILSYATTSLSFFPLFDKYVFYIDKSMHFNWHDFVYLIDQSDIFCRILGYCYSSIWIQPLSLACAAVVIKNYRLTDGIFISLCLSLIITCAIAFAVPTVGVTTIEPNNFDHLDVAGGVAGQPTFLALRNGSLRVIDFNAIFGLLTFPSYHSVVAVLAILAARHIPYALGPVVILDSLMLISTFTHGGHYLADVLVGALIAVFCWRASIALTNCVPTGVGRREQAARETRSPITL